mmetsp:Transcript_10806/g.34298  ORF Transcript_10806/g.34298 Transcript_10806/m.34298 type:complete len:100 (-) Transcript_10806:2998-3297(-)
MFAKVKAGAASAAESTKRGAKKGQLKMQIESLHSKIEKEKQKFGVAAWEPMKEADDDQVKALFAEHLATVDALHAEIDGKHEEIAKLEAEGAAAGAKDD